ncbi:MAG: putative Ig domain-containing protein, partial [Gammaproteobacteria bacterium]|nr:putative Ig domain-containing protein [Gammaproteobacteria bacterium]
NTPPVISGTPSGSVVVNESYSFQPAAADADGNTLAFIISGRPDWASFNTSTGRLSGTPTQSGSHSNIVISVSDGSSTVSLPAFSIQVTPPPVVNTPPVISGTPSGSVVANESYDFQPTATDNDGNALTFSISGRPAWASFNNSTGRLSGTPGDTQTGNYNGIVISVTDGTDTVSLPSFSVRVDPAPVVNTPPVINGNPASSVIAGNAYSFQPTAADADGDALTFSISGRPAWASFNTSTGRLSGTPTQSGSHGNIVISVTDGTDTVSLPAFSIQVNASTGSFSLSWSAPTTRADGSPISLADIDGYRVYYGSAPGNYPNSVDITDGTTTATTVNNIPVGGYYVVMTTYDTSGLESAQSSAVNKQAQ